jgi:hypothetical protein
VPPDGSKDEGLTVTRGSLLRRGSYQVLVEMKPGLAKDGGGGVDVLMEGQDEAVSGNAALMGAALGLAVTGGNPVGGATGGIVGMVTDALTGSSGEAEVSLDAAVESTAAGGGGMTIEEVVEGAAAAFEKDYHKGE